MTRAFEMTEAKRDRVPLLIGLMGPSGSCKTFSAMRLAKGIQAVSGGEIAVVQRIEARQAVMPVPVDERRIEFWCGRHAEILLRKAGERQYR